MTAAWAVDREFVYIVLWRPLGRLWALWLALGCPWAPFGHPLGSLWLSWATFSLPLGVLGRPLAPFWSPLGRFGSLLASAAFFEMLSTLVLACVFLITFGAILETCWLPF